MRMELKLIVLKIRIKYYQIKWPIPFESIENSGIKIVNVLVYQHGETTYNTLTL
jgi:hypothetical protein